MCGIAGILNIDGAPARPEQAERMVRRLHHRGPDERAVFVDEAVALGHARLSIIDVTGGQQPMSNADGTLWITFNGEIFNYVELRDQLADAGHRFATRSDTEVILHLYERYGTDCVRFMNGQWAFAIWDARTRSLFLSRDRMGVRPLFYTRTGGAFLFASEIKALFADPRVDRRLDLQALDELFTFWTPLAPRTMFEGVTELPPGHSLVVRDGELRQSAYWQPGYDAPAVQSASQAAERLLELLVDATRIRLRADVPVGAYLSGGLDSTVITALIKRFTDTPLRTFSVTFEDEDFDESRFQRAAIDHLHTEHEAIHCAGSDIAEAFPDVVWHAEKPVLRTAPAPLFLLSRLVRERGYKVVLTGEGSDEILGGYDIFKEAKIRRFWSRIPESKLRPILLRRLYPYMQNIQAQPEAYLRAFFRTSADDCADPFFSHLPRWGLTARLKLFFTGAVQSALTDIDALGRLTAALPAAYQGWDAFSRAQYLETSILLPGYILSSQGDRMAMAHSVEGRFPFLDHRVVDFAASLHPNLKMKVLDEKHTLKRAAEGLIPDEVLRRKKQPYRAPDAKSFFGPAANRAGYVDALLSPESIRAAGLFNAHAVGRLVAKARAGQTLGTRDNMGLVGILSTQLLVHHFITRNVADADASARDTRVHRREFSVRAGV